MTRRGWLFLMMSACGLSTCETKADTGAFRVDRANKPAGEYVEFDAVQITRGGFAVATPLHFPQPIRMDTGDTLAFEYTFTGRKDA